MSYRVKMQKGFSLIELMIVIAVIGVIASIAFPNYRENVKQGRRTDAQSALMSFAASLEREYTKRGSYLNADGSGSAGTKKSPAAAIFSDEAPIGGDAKFYDLRVTFDATSYTVYALPKGAQKDDGPFLLRSTGARGWAKKLVNSSADTAYTDDW